MNNRIDDMIKQSGGMRAHDTRGFGDGYVFSDESFFKFVESVIRECADVALREDHEPSECILNHFGVTR
jgi:hypothetical protein